MLILNKYTKDQYTQLENTVVKISKSCKTLTPRSLTEVRKWLDFNFVFYAYENESVVGWVVSEPVDSTTFEIKSLYAVPEFSRKGIGNALIKEVSKNPLFNYISATYNPIVLHILEENNFEVVNLIKLPKKTLYAYLKTRKTSALFKGIRRKVYICYKKTNV